MNRSPLFYPLNRGMDADAGGAADLQTDVMRFMAIISMCLVAIFAIVQSIPLAPVVESPPEPVAEVTVDDPPPEPVPDEPVEDIVLTRPERSKPAPPPEPVALERPRATVRQQQTPPVETVAKTEVDQPIPAAPVEPPPEPASTASTVQKGFTLRFESDRALTRLVEQDVVGLYAISDEQTMRMNVSGSQYSFWSASAPTRFHEMDAGTVPDPVIAAFRRRSASPSDTKWGVSLPTGMSRSLNEYLQAHEGGALVIGLDGQLRMEQ